MSEKLTIHEINIRSIEKRGRDLAERELLPCIEALTAALQQISDMGPMSVDDQRWRIARDTLDALRIKENAPSV